MEINRNSIMLTKNQLMKLKRVHSAMLSRCTNPKVESYPRYGARGIKVCAEWMTFTGFIQGIPQGYADGLTLDRIDNNKGYCPDNCRWATYSVQNSNRDAYGVTKLKGAYPLKGREGFRSSITLNKKAIQLGIFKTPEEAARVFDMVVEESFPNRFTNDLGHVNVDLTKCSPHFHKFTFNKYLEKGEA